MFGQGRDGFNNHLKKINPDTIYVNSFSVLVRMVFGNVLGNFSLLDLLVTKTAGNYFGKVDLPNMSFHVCLQRKLFLAYNTREQFPSCILLRGSHFAYFQLTGY